MKRVKIPKLIYLIIIPLFLCLFIRVIYISLSSTIDGRNIQAFAANRTTTRITLPAKRGTIYDVNDEVLAKNVFSYNIIAYLDPKRTTSPEFPRHVVDKEKTSDALSKVLDLDKDYILKQLNKDGLYQVEFGSKGKNLSELKKDEIVALGLPGIDFEESTKRYYPYGEFLSYTLGYANLESNQVIGKMGIEKYLNDTLVGKDGYVEFQKDRKGYKIPDTPEARVKEVNGKNVYLTIDSHIQLFVEQAVRKTKENASWDWYSFLMMDAKTGDLLAVYQDPSFDPNKRNITNYLDYNFSYPYEPGSTMKTYTYMLAMEKGIYKADKLFQSGTYTTKDGTVIRDWKLEGWGRITYEKGFEQSANTAVMDMINSGISGNELKSFYQKIGFGKKIGMPLFESAGTLPFKYETEILNASFGQGLTTTALQHAQALTIVANGGNMVKPNLISKITEYGKTTPIYERQIEVTPNVVKPETAKEALRLMKNNVVNSKTTGSAFRLEGYDLALKTGTAQVPRLNGKGYSNSTIQSAAGVWPASDPEIIFIVAVQNPRFKGDSTHRKAIINPLHEVIKNTSGYLNMFNKAENLTQKEEVNFKSFLNKSVDDVKSYYKDKALIIGDGTKIIKEYPYEGIDISNYKKVFFRTDGEIKKLPSFIGLSQKDGRALCSLLDIKCAFTGSGFIYEEDLEKKEFKLKEKS